MTPARRVVVKLVTTVRVVWMLGFNAVTDVAFMVSGLTKAEDAVLRLTHAEDNVELLRSVQVKGVIVVGNMGKTIIK